MLTPKRHRRVTGLLVALAVLGCSDSPTAPSFPQVEGTYDFTAAFDLFPVARANVTGTLTLAQPDPTTGNLNAFPTLELEIDGDVSFIGQFTNASVSTAGRVLFEVPSSSVAESWTFDGTLVAGGRSISGRHTLRGVSSLGPASFSGTWSAIKR